MAQDFESITPADFQSPDQLPPEKRWQFRPVYALGAFALLLVIFVLYFLLNAKAVVFKTNPENAEISISGGISMPIGESVLLLKGDYQIGVQAQGYHPLIKQLTVETDTPPEITYEMNPLPGNLQISLIGEEEITGSAILRSSLLENFIVIEAPDALRFEGLEAGNYQVTLDANLYATKTVDIDLPGKGLTHQVEVELEPNWGWLELQTAPYPARLNAESQVIDNSAFSFDALQVESTDLDQGHLRARLEAGTHEIQLFVEDFKPVYREIKIEQAAELDLGLIKLEHVDSKISLLTDPPDVSVLVNEEYVGETPITLDLQPDQTHQLKLFKAGYRTISDSIDVEKNAELSLNFDLDPDLVQVSLSVFPENAVLNISGKRVNANGGQISLPAITQQVEVSAAGYETQKLDFLPIRGTRQHLQVRLLTTEQALWANIPTNYKSKVGQNLQLFRDAGDVTMGSSRRETGRRANETNWSARLERPFYASLTEVTNQQFKAYDPEHSSGHFEGVSLDGANQPVINVSWQQAALFCNWLSEQEGLEPFYTTERGFVSGHNKDSTGYRLLTEAEWTWLAKMNASGFPQKYIWGDADEITSPVENFADQSVANLINFTLESVNDSYVTTAPVGSFPANDKGIFDISGNVNEWMHDWYDTEPYESGESVIDPLGPDEGEFHVIRGASWARGYLPQLRLAYRDYDSTGRNDLGFRVARYAM